MPDNNGYVFIENLKRIRGYEKTPILVISSLGGDLLKKRQWKWVSGFLLNQILKEERCFQL